MFVCLELFAAWAIIWALEFESLSELPCIGVTCAALDNTSVELAVFVEATYIFACIIFKSKTETHRQGHGPRMIRRAVVGCDMERICIKDKIKRCEEAKKECRQ